jgi:hypothetical protein
VLTWLKIRLGYVEKIQFHGTQVWWQTKSISFNSMGQDEFSQFFNDSIDLICFEILPGMDPETLVAEAELSSGVNANEVRIKDGIRTA